MISVECFVNSQFSWSEFYTDNWFLQFEALATYSNRPLFNFGSLEGDKSKIFPRFEYTSIYKKGEVALAVLSGEKSF